MKHTVKCFLDEMYLLTNFKGRFSLCLNPNQKLVSQRSENSRSLAISDFHRHIFGNNNSIHFCQKSRYQGQRVASLNNYISC